MFGRGPVEQPGRDVRGGIGRRQVGKREDVDGILRRSERLGVARRLGKAVIEVPAAGAGDMDEQAVEDLTAFFVGVEALIDEVPQEAAAL